MPTPLHKKADLEEIRRRFDKDVERFSNLATGQEATVDAPLVMEMIAKAALAATPQARRVLDIGCGAGNNTLKLLEFIQPLACDLIDLSEPMLKQAFKRISSVNPGPVKIFQGDMRTIELPEENYNIIFAAAVLHHLREDKDWEDMFAKLYRLTAHGGSLWITDLVSHENTAIQNLMWQRYGDYLESIGGREYREKVFTYVDKEDSPRPLSYQLELLRKVGFKQVEVLHKNSCFAAFGAIKQ